MKISQKIEFELFLGRYVEGVVGAISKDEKGWKLQVEYSANGDCATVRPDGLTPFLIRAERNRRIEPAL